MSFISAVPENKRPALFQSLLFEACGQTVNPVNGAVGLLSTENWQISQAAVETMLAGGTLSPVPVGILPPNTDQPPEALARGSCLRSSSKQRPITPSAIGSLEYTASFVSGLSEGSPEFGKGKRVIATNFKIVFVNEKGLMWG